MILVRVDQAQRPVQARQTASEGLGREPARRGAVEPVETAEGCRLQHLPALEWALAASQKAAVKFEAQAFGKVFAAVLCDFLHHDARQGSASA